VLATPLLSVAGLKARLELKDHLILQDLLDYNEKRTRLIQRLETDVDQARVYLDSLTKDDSIAEQVAMQITEYKTALLATLLNILNQTVAPAVKHAVLDQLSQQMEV